MKKALKIILIVLLILALSLGMVGCGIIGFVSWVWGGVRFSPDAAMEAVGIGYAQQPRIEGEDCYFYYSTFADDYYEGEEMDDWICRVTPVRKSGWFMWHATPDPRGELVYTEEEQQAVGRLIAVEVSGKFYNFFLITDGGTNPPSFPAALADGYTHVSVNGERIEVFKHSYFVTDAPVEVFEINGTRMVVGGKH